jgi:hypothetical protein
MDVRDLRFQRKDLRIGMSYTWVDMNLTTDGMVAKRQGSEVVT